MENINLGIFALFVSLVSFGVALYLSKSPRQREYGIRTEVVSPQRNDDTMSQESSF